ncbi:MraY family glycosyltransferase [Zunongwangia sp. F363]|uniref:MraY family glycosyltransferase n=1 Tax=Autumnicola tepida TaxID=3075595 RepID=A0ABU3C7M5_9FLAO|nr:MraY family glycosyltransferase [Zunongwangia sp. F363]MDT0642317.1 MraY family glycosyltransferase [Zunongwangia sp. F363]
MNILDQQVILDLFRAYYPLFLGVLFLSTFAFTFYTIPKILWVSQEKKLTASVNERSSHLVETPSFGGVAFFITIVLVLSVIQSLRLGFVGNHLIAAMSILFLVGLKDDLVVSTARVKLFGQVAAACFIVFSPELRLNSLHGFLGIYEIPEAVGYCLSALLLVALINAYNLIDGIDGLAAITGIVISAVYGGIFYTTGHPYYVLLSVSLMGTLFGFLRFNFSRGRRKIFMGDSGSLPVGLILGLLTLKVLVMEPVSLISQGYNSENRILLVACVLFIPVFDTLRVMIIRLLSGKSPFSADRNHAHHVLLDLGLNHARASASLAFLNLLVVTIYLSLSNLLPQVWMLFVVVSLYSGSFFLFSMLKARSAGAARKSHSAQHSMR